MSSIQESSFTCQQNTRHTPACHFPCIDPSLFTEDNSKLNGLDGEANGGEVDWDIGIDSTGQAEGQEDIDWDIDVGDEPPEATREGNDAGPSTGPTTAGTHTSPMHCYSGLFMAVKKARH